ncbi:hypothetical protein J4230_02620 [Candidatus Woesearchaeota archaeon]|nr:hypothetical protein [Candidatus Woesearchaeota archaeon]
MKGRLNGLLYVMEEHKVINHPFLKDFRDGKFTKEQVKFWAEQQFFFSVSLPNCFAALFARIPDKNWKIKRSLVDLLKLEAWGSSDDGAHSNYFKELCKYLKVDLGDLSDKQPKSYTYDYINERLRYCLQEPIENGLAVIAIGNEKINLHIFSAYREGINKVKGLEHIPTGYFDAHLQDEDNDFLVFSKLFDSIVYNERQMIGARVALESLLNKRKIYFDKLYSDLLKII